MKLIFFVFLLLVIFCSCGTDKRLYTTYFRDIPDSIQNFEVADTAFRPLVIKPDDLLQINISSPNAEANAFFITPGANITNINNAGASTPTPNTYLVDNAGGIDIPLAGRIILKGLTMAQAREAIKSKLLNFLKDPIITVRLQNFKVTVLGEVARPSSYILSNERVSVLDALGLAGDLTIFGKRDNVLLIRESGNKKIISRLNLGSSALFQSPEYYLQQNDIVYVEANHAKAKNSDQTTFKYITIVTSVLSLLVIILTRVVK